MASAKTSTLKFCTTSGLKGTLRTAAARERLSIANMAGVLMPDRFGPVEASLAAQRALLGENGELEGGDTIRTGSKSL